MGTAKCTEMTTLRTISETDWSALAQRFSDLNFEQTLTYARAAASRIGARVQFVTLEQDGRPIAAAAVRIKTVPGLGRGIALISSGPLLRVAGAPEPDVAQICGVLRSLRTEFLDRQGHVLRIRPPASPAAIESGFDAAAIAMGFEPTNRTSAYHSITLDLRKDRETLLHDLNGKWRTDLRFALKSGLSLERGHSPALAARFLAMFDQVQTAKGFRPALPPAFHFTLQGEDFPRDILIATKDGSDVGGIVVGSAGATATYLFGATPEAGRRLRAGYFLTWEGITLSRDRGLAWYDLGGIDQDANPSVARFKMRMNGVEIRSNPVEARPAGPGARLVTGLETLHGWLRQARR